ncbi:acylphosphatase [Izhakiella capsodis]|uniref:Acylphosphatase n=1 Tax=Izhakiella capsodis TaxID=1367852 RepID=A0A1I4UPV7_9GAMM|nr:acylphosphatase [Izhakiella capsodis]SFM91037.1 acylphosphatase [Izhakiella capsodis]
MVKKGVLAWAYGRVQGVGFRYSTQRKARELGLCGHARNLDDGSVEVLVWGDCGQVDSLISWLKAGGPCRARVDRVLTEPHQPQKEPRRFSIH